MKNKNKKKKKKKRKKNYIHILSFLRIKYFMQSFMVH